jgi:phospholipid/cholesterol/gamma-HCH transport system substrate-binding protein
MMHIARCTAVAAVVLVISAALCLSGCQWRGLNSVPLPGTVGGGPGSFVVRAQMPDVSTMQQNSRVRVHDVNVGTVTKIERQGWHAMVTMRLRGDVDLPANATAKIGQTSLLGSVHVELAPPKGVPPEGKLHDGSLIPLSAAGAYPTTEQTLAALSMLLNGGGFGRVQEITQAFSTAFAGREADLRSLITQLDIFIARLNDQTADIIHATDSLNNLAGQFADQKPVIDRALQTIPDALSVLEDQRDILADALDKLGKFSAVVADSVDKTKDNLVKELREIGPVLQSLADAGPALTRSLNLLATYPWKSDAIPTWVRGDYGNLSVIIDLTLSRIDNSMFAGTRFEGNLTELEMQWGRTIGMLPSPYTNGNPLTIPYRLDQGP